jgi:hypothetical protein
MLLFGPPVQLLSPWPLINYLSVYLFVNSPFITPYHPSAETLDTVVPVIDALTRSFPISGAVLAATSHSNPAIRGSLMYQDLNPSYPLFWIPRLTRFRRRRCLLRHLRVPHLQPPGLCSRDPIPHFASVPHFFWWREAVERSHRTLHDDPRS